MGWTRRRPTRGHRRRARRPRGDGVPRWPRPDVVGTTRTRSPWPSPGTAAWCASVKNPAYVSASQLLAAAAHRLLNLWKYIIRRRQTPATTTTVNTHSGTVKRRSILHIGRYARDTYNIILNVCYTLYTRKVRTLGRNQSRTNEKRLVDVKIFMASRNSHYNVIR